MTNRVRATGGRNRRPAWPIARAMTLDRFAARSLFSPTAGRAAPTASPIWEPTCKAGTPGRTAVPRSAPYDAALCAICETPVHGHETAAVGFARKEAELRAAIAALSILDARELYARLSASFDGDDVVAAFARLTPERRARLIAFAGDARRRAALAGR
jgi:hypothetical protein